MTRITYYLKSGAAAQVDDGKTMDETTRDVGMFLSRPGEVVTVTAPGRRTMFNAGGVERVELD